MEEKIIELYNQGFSYRKIERELNISFTKVKKTVDSINYDRLIKEKYPEYDSNGYKLNVVCKKTERVFIDYLNTSGCLTNHITSTYPDFILESNFKRKSFEYKENDFWYRDFFDFKYFPVKETKKCPYCDWETPDTDNISGAYHNHMINVHNISIDDHLTKYPEDKIFFKNHVRAIENKIELEKDFVICKVCNEKLKQINNTHLKKHGITIREYKQKFNSHSMLSNTTTKKLQVIYDKHLKHKPFSNVSSYEKELIDIIQNELNINVITSDRKVLDGKEINILIPDMNIGIEFDGLYSHSEISGKKDRQYHRSKTILASKKGVRLIHIFEDEYVNKKHLVISKIKHILNTNDQTKIFARKCIIKKISNSDKAIFLENNHIQGNDNSIIAYGCYYKNELVSVMTFDNERNFSKSSQHNKDTYELKRFASKIDYNVIGSFGKILSKFMKDRSPEKIVSFADLRWTDINNNIYIKNNFILDKILPPDYSYYNCKEDKYYRFHKFQFGKKSLAKKFPLIYSDHKSEWEIMQEAGFDRIWDCGKARYILEKKV